ncbi:MAG: hypothetical protein DMF64_21400 [Acidobacteria bacterium]|nr:MAG: hypothetical protein DMF64_21400 [Acidobacteriota bacterium]
MKNRFYVVALLIYALTIVTIFSWSYKRVEAEMRFNKKDLPEHGIFIITEADPNFEALISAYSRRHPQTPINDLKLFSIFIENSTDRTVVGYRLRWACKKTDGTIIDKVVTETTLWALTNILGPNTESALKHADRVIGPKSYRFISLAAPSESMTGQVSDTDQNSEEELQILKTELRNYTEITVNLDGLFFDDGSFIGTDNKYYGEIKASVDASNDVLKEIESGIQEGKSANEIFKSIEEAANGPDIRLSSASTSRDHYLYEKKLSAQEILNIRKYKGDAKAFEHVRMRLGRTWPVIHKL